MAAHLKPAVSLIAAVARDGGIGCRNQLLWRNSQDLQRFKRLTMGHPIVMGRKTWDSIGRPLPGRRNIVVSRNQTWAAQGAERVGSMGEALAACADVGRLYVIGGAQIYAAALPLADELILTEIDATFEADAYFPTWDRADFELTASEAGDAPPEGPAFRFATYTRR